MVRILSGVDRHGLTLIRAAIKIDVVVRLEVIYDLQATNRREGGGTSCRGRSRKTPGLHLERARDRAGNSRTAWREDLETVWAAPELLGAPTIDGGSARPGGSGGEIHRSHIYLHSLTK
jgi:hypothetical protein